MPAPAQGQPQSVNHTLIERAFRGVNLSAGPTSIPDGYMQRMENLMPYDDAHVVVTPGQLPVGNNVVGSVVQLWAFVLNDTEMLLAQLSDGSVQVATIGTWAWTTVTAAGNTTPNGLHMIKWSGVDADGNPEAILWVDTAKGYGSWDGSTWKVLQAGITGQALVVYAGRVWIASAEQVFFTAPDTYNDFNAADFAGSFTITDPSFVGPVVALQVAQGWLYLAGAGLMALNNVQIVSVAGSTTLTTTWYMTAVSSSLCIRNERAVMVWNDTLLCLSDDGLWVYYGLNGKRISETMGDNFSGSQSLFAMQLYGRNLIVTSAGYVLMLEEQRWYTMIADAESWITVAQFTNGVVRAFAAVSYYANTEIVKLSADWESFRNCDWTTRLYDAGNASIAKRVTKCGIEMWQDELNLIHPVPDANYGTVTQQVLGYTGASEILTDEFSVIQNVWLPHAINLNDRYFGMSGTLYAPPGSAIAGIFFQFQDSTTWPALNTAPPGPGGVG